MSGNRDKGRSNSPVEDRIPVADYLGELGDAAVGEGFAVETFARIAGHALPVLTRNLEREKILYVSTGVHGDEPAGPLAVLGALRRGVFTRDFGWVVFPVLNPTGLERSIRENAEGIDVNRDYLQLRSAEAKAHRRWLEASGHRYLAALGLHEDWEASGGYLYEHNTEGLPVPQKALLEGLRKSVGLEEAGEIDGWPTDRTGLINPPSNPDLRDFWPEQIYLLKHHTTISYTVETPSDFPLAERVGAAVDELGIFGQRAAWV